jgi:HPt (histidine-containing phosphotransfer) domain-containing protein
MNDTQTSGPIFSDFASDPDFEDLLEMFAETVGERRVLLQQQFRDGSVDEMRVTAHQLKGAGGGYGFDGLSSVAAELEQACKENDIDRVGQISIAERVVPAPLHEQFGNVEEAFRCVRSLHEHNLLIDR